MGKKSEVKKPKTSAKTKKSVSGKSKISEKSVAKQKTSTKTKKPVAKQKSLPETKKSVSEKPKVSKKPVAKQKDSAEPKKTAKREKKFVLPEFGEVKLDLKLVKKKKAADVRAELESGLIDAFRKSARTEINMNSKPKQVCIICTDESIVSGYLLADYANEVSKTPITVTDDRRIPGWFDEDSLAIIVSKKENGVGFSDSLKKIVQSGSKIVTITDFDYSYSNNALTKIVSGEKPEIYDYIGHTMGMLAAVLAKAGVVSMANMIKIVDRMAINDEAASVLMKQMKTDFEKIIVINYLPNLRSAARLMKIVIPKYARRIVFSTEYPEFNHNEIVGWCVSQTRSQKFVNLFLCDKNAPKLLDVITKSELEILRDNKVITKEMTIEGKNNFEKNLSLFLSCECVIGGI